MPSTSGKTLPPREDVSGSVGGLSATMATIERDGGTIYGFQRQAPVVGRGGSGRCPDSSRVVGRLARWWPDRDRDDATSRSDRDTSTNAADATINREAGRGASTSRCRRRAAVPSGPGSSTQKFRAWSHLYVLDGRRIGGGARNARRLRRSRRVDGAQGRVPRRSHSATARRATSSFRTGGSSMKLAPTCIASHQTWSSAAPWPPPRWLPRGAPAGRASGRCAGVGNCTGIGGRRSWARVEAAEYSQAAP